MQVIILGINPRWTSRLLGGGFGHDYEEMSDAEDASRGPLLTGEGGERREDFVSACIKHARFRGATSTSTSTSTQPPRWMVGMGIMRWGYHDVLLSNHHTAQR